MKVQELEGAELDAAVAKLEGWYWDEPDENPIPVSTDWRYAGPIIERERIEASPCSPMNWGNVEHRWMALAYLPEPHVSAHGPTPLIAAMRAYVASKESA